MLACLAVLAAPSRALPSVAGAGAGVVGAVGVVYGVAAISGGLAPVSVGWLVPLAGLRLAADATSGLFMVVTGAVGVVVGIYTAGYAAHGHMGRTPLSVLPLFLACMLGVPLADSVTTFLFLWELMALSSLLLVLAEARRREVRDAGVWCAAMTHLGFVAVLVGLVVFAAAAGAEGFPELSASAASLSPATRSAVFLLTVAGFGSKAGLVPLHAWLPRAHPEAPGPVSALMSAAMVNLGIYGILRVDVTLLGPGPRWWGLALLAAGAVTAVYGVLQAAVATDLKRLLAYSTSENMGLICVALGTAMLLTASGIPAVAAVAMTAALVHLVGHAAFKSLGFLAAGAVAAATGLRDLDAFGGLAPRMPTTTAAFGIAALGASGLPLGCGFVGEWLLLQSLVHALPAGGTMVALVMPLTVGVVALTTGLGTAAMVKAFGVGFLARPRSAEAERASEVGRAMAVGMGLAALACGVLAVAPAVLAPALSRVLPELPAGAGTPQPRLGALLRLPGVGGSMSPALLALGVAAGVLLAFGATQWRARRRPAPRTAELWACGGGALTARMQYTATSFAEPLQRVFDGVLRPDVELAVTHYSQAPYLVAKVTYRSRLRDTVETSLYTPVIRAVAAAARIARRAHMGSIHAYLAYGAAGLIVALLVAR
ncbi:proton-conducting transporter transmembrane domain-containing protein [Frankia tisae]|uniref:proton-conducting transporter transmembrane domain-containing protein n=1 Tax=Frankia tisae TaxID=2950104 RepID=UPI003F685A9E